MSGTTHKRQFQKELKAILLIEEIFEFKKWYGEEAARERERIEWADDLHAARRIEYLKSLGHAIPEHLK